MAYVDQHGVGVSGAKRLTPKPIRVARECYKEADGNVEHAAFLMRKRLEDDSSLFREVMQPLVESAVWNLVQQVKRDERSAIKTEAAAVRSGRTVRGRPAAEPTRAERKAVNRANTGTRDSLEYRWFEFALSDGTRLGNARRKQVEEQADSYATAAYGHAVNARFFRAIAAALPNNRVTVRGHFGDAEAVDKLWRKAEAAQRNAEEL